VEFAGNDRFEVLARIGAGGMGVVYRAHDRDRNARVALKTLRALTADGILRFKNEFRALQDLQHPNLVNLGELISDGGQWFFTMELVEGVDFLSWVRPVMGFHARPASSDFAMSTAPSGATTLPPDGGRLAYEARAGEAMRPELDEVRLRAALEQLGRGFSVLHAAGKVHRDIKPSNVLVTRDGRVVLLDFGLATEVGAGGHSELNVVGTADYMAPEQAASRSLGPPADWYSLGVMLYEALTGKLPFSGAPLEVLIAKQRGEPPSVLQVARQAPRDLATLCDALLARDPAARPSGAEVMRALGADRPDEVRPTAASAPFVGRARELDQLRGAFAASREGPVSVLVQGESGVGKSALVRQLLERLRAEVRGVVVLAGRCYERESVPYKALDGVIDALARWMMRIPAVEAAALLPLRANLLAQVFPVLKRVEVIAKAPGGAPAPVDPVELRRRTFLALRELFVRASARHPLAIAIDDLQWADGDSLALLSEILQPPDAPSLLLVATVRFTEGSGPGSVASNLATALAGDVRHLPLERLTPDESRQLVTLLAERSHAGRLSADSTRAIADEAGGHPLFIDELVRHVTAGGEALRDKLHLEDALWARVCRLDEGERKLLELVTVAGGPLPLSAAARALIDGGEPDAAAAARLASLLRGANLVRSSGGTDEALEPYHDRVRAAVCAHLDAPSLKALHRKLALALEPQHADPETLSLHFRGAGEPLKAAHYADLAAAEAARALAFERAVSLYRMALQLDPEGSATRDRQIGLGEALATVGRCGDAALCFLTAAKLARSSESLELQRRASEQLLISGHIDEGLVGIHTVLAHFDLALATTPRRAFLSLLVRRARLRLRGLGHRERAERDVPLSMIRRIDTCWSVAMGLAMVDTIRGADFQTRHLLYALEAGEPVRLARALAMESAFTAAAGKDPERAQELLHAAARLAARTGSAHALGTCDLVEGINAYLQGRWKRAHELFQSALEILRERCTNVPWEINTASQFSLLSLGRMGHVAEMMRLMPSLRRSARERGDLYQTVALRAGLMCLPTLAADEPDRAREDLKEAFEKWSTRSFQMQHFWEVYSKAYVDLYESDGRTALDRLIARWPVLERSLIFETAYVRLEALHLRANALLATATRLPPGAPERDELVRKAERDIRELERGAPWAQAVAKLLEAGLAAVRGQTARAIALLDEAISACEASDMFLLGAAARRRRGELEGGPSGEALAAAAAAWMSEQKIRAPRRMCALLAPGFPD